MGKLKPGRKLKPLAEILVRDGLSGHAQVIKWRLIKAGLKENRCEPCGIGPEWNGEKLVLQLDHINGIKTDWRLENLKMVCPNCHTQTSTFVGKRLKGKANPHKKDCACPWHNK